MRNQQYQFAKEAYSLVLLFPYSKPFLERYLLEIASMGHLRTGITSWCKRTSIANVMDAIRRGPWNASQTVYLRWVVYGAPSGFLQRCHLFQTQLKWGRMRAQVGIWCLNELSPCRILMGVQTHFFETHRISPECKGLPSLNSWGG